MAGKKGTGGATSHKNPDCLCSACTARRRKAEALALTAGAGGSSLGTPTVDVTEGTVNADAPVHISKIHGTRARISQWLTLKALDPDITNAEAAEKIGIQRGYLQHCIAEATREGWLKFHEPISRIEHEIIPKALDNLNELLINKNKMATIETVKNTVFKQYLESKGVRDAPTTVLAIRIDAAPADTVDGEVVRAMTGHIVGTPRELEKH